MLKYECFIKTSPMYSLCLGPTTKSHSLYIILSETFSLLIIVVSRLKDKELLDLGGGFGGGGACYTTFLFRL